MKKNGRFKRSFARVVSLVMISFVCLLFTGCIGNDSTYSSGLKEAYENGEISLEEYLQKRQESMSVPLYGTKLVYQPDNYDFEGGTGGTTEGETTKSNAKFFEKYAFTTLQYLAGTYGTLFDYSNAQEFTNDETIEKLTDFFAATDDPNRIFSYDAMRYSVKEYNSTNVKETPFVYKQNGETGVWEKDEASASYIAEKTISVKADTSTAWNFSFGYDNPALPGYVYESDANTTLTSFVENESITNISRYNKDGDANENEYKIFFNNFYTDTNITNYNTYIDILLGGTEFNPNYDTEETSTYSPTQFVKALEYAIYSYNLNLVPNALIFDEDANGNTLISVNGYVNDETGLSLDKALAYIKDAYKKIGSFVGIREEQKPKLANWIMENVVGQQVQNEYTLTQNIVDYNLYFKNVKANGATDAAGTKYYTDSSGNYLYITEGGTKNYVTDAAVALNMTVAQYQSQPSGESIVIDRKLDEVVAWVVHNVNKTINIGDTVVGDDNQQGPALDESYLASEMVDYFGNDFFIASDDAFANIPARQYQSMTLMFGKDFEFSNLMLFFEYDAGNDGQGVVDESKQLQMDIVINQYKKSNNTYRRVTMQENGESYDTFPITLKDGPFSYGENYCTMMLFGLKEIQPNGDVTGIRVGEFNTEIGNGILKTMPTYNGLTSIGTPKQITGNDDLRKYYQLQTGMIDDENKMYTYGTLNPSLFSGADGCDFFEINFIVYKTPGDTQTNYHFNVGLGLIA